MQPWLTVLMIIEREMVKIILVFLLQSFWFIVCYYLARMVYPEMQVIDYYTKKGVAGQLHVTAEVQKALSP